MVRNTICTINGVSIVKVYVDPPFGTHVYHAVEGKKSTVFKTYAEALRFAERIAQAA